MPQSMVPAAGTRWQREAGIDDSAEVFHADIMRKTKGRAYPVLARALTEVGPELVDWLADSQGLELNADGLRRNGRRLSARTEAQTVVATDPSLSKHPSLAQRVKNAFLELHTE